MGNMKEWFEKQLGRQISQQRFMKVYDHFKDDLDKQMESEYGDDDHNNGDEGKSEYSMDDQNMIDNLYSSFYKEEQEKNQMKKKEQKLTKMILQTLIGTKNNNQEIGLKKAIKENQGLDTSIAQLNSKLGFLEGINKAHVFLKNLMTKNSLRSKRVKDENAVQMEAITSKLIIQLQQLQNEVEEKECIDEGNMQEAMKEFVRECASMNLIPPSLYKAVVDNRIQFVNMNM